MSFWGTRDVPQKIENREDIESLLNSQKDLPETCCIWGDDPKAGLADLIGTLNAADLGVTRIFMSARIHATLRQFGRDILDIETQAKLLKIGYMGRAWGAEVYCSRAIPEDSLLLEWSGEGSEEGFVKARVLTYYGSLVYESLELIQDEGLKKLAKAVLAAFESIQRRGSPDKDKEGELFASLPEVAAFETLLRYSELKSRAACRQLQQDYQVYFNWWAEAQPSSIIYFFPDEAEPDEIPRVDFPKQNPLSTIASAFVSGAGMAVASQLGKAVAHAVGVPEPLPAIMASAGPESLRTAARESITAQTFEAIQARK